MKTWRNNEKKSVRIIAFGNDTIYKANPQTDKIDECILNLSTGNVSTRQIFAVPIAYVKSIELAKRKTYIEVFFGSDSNEHLRISDEKTRNEVFEYLQKNLTGFTHSVEKYSRIKAGKKPLIAMIILTLLFAYTFYIANGMEHGVECEVVGHYNSIAGIK